MGKKGILLAAICSMSVRCCLAGFSISSLQEMEGNWQDADENTLVVFDVDEVLMTTEDHFMHPYAEDAVLSFVIQAVMFAGSEEEKKALENSLSLSLILPSRPLIEKDSPHIIRRLQDKGVKVIALTNCPTGPLGVIPKVEQWRIDQLKAFDIDFSLSFPEVESCFLEIGAETRSLPFYQEGVLFSKGYKKGDVLISFMKQAGFYPSKVIFIDDLLENIQSVESSMKDLQIETQAYQYTGASRFFRNSVNEEILHYQFNSLVNTGQWVGDAEVEKRLLLESLK